MNEYHLASPVAYCCAVRGVCGMQKVGVRTSRRANKVWCGRLPGCVFANGCYSQHFRDPMRTDLSEVSILSN
ncbi:hypothetical protein EVAR_3005_1 [Eumeta japonica]|uniref:Uncharacterized protein n=1 Tax=Eumeta variegata TaxID=151549 RepID=A0A4C1STN4_EUMVA|nr:hypothetical protein EVAR_3005_1 [Eumeta japonica]